MVFIVYTFKLSILDNVKVSGGNTFMISRVDNLKAL